MLVKSTPPIASPITGLMTSLDEAADDAGEGGADNDADREVDDIPPHDKRAKFADPAGLLWQVETGLHPLPPWLAASADYAREKRITAP